MASEPAPRQDQLPAEIARVLRPGAVLVASDSLASEQLRGLHDGVLRTNEFGWAAVAYKG